MNSIETLTTFLGWCTFINVVLLVFVLLIANFFHESIGAVHARIFGVSREEAKATFFRVFQQFRLFVGIFNLIPYIALKIMF